MEQKIGNIPPQNIEAEQALLGAIMLEREAIINTIDIITRESFYKENHSIIYSSIIDLFERGEPVDLVTVHEDLKSKNKLEEIGGVEYISYLADTVVTTANARRYAEIVEEKHILREMIKVGNQIIKWGYEEDEDIEMTLANAQKAIFELSKKGTTSDILTMKNIMKNTLEELAKRYDEKRGFSGLSTGFPDIDKITGGFYPSEFIVLASRPGMGKSSLALNIAYHVGIELKKAVALFSLEMSAEQLSLRLLSSVAEIDGRKFRSGFLSESEWKRASKQLGILSNAPIFIVDTTGLTPVEMRAKARRIQLESEQELSLIIVDYLQLMNVPKKENRVQEISEISRELKLMARELNVPVLAISQLSRAVEQRVNKKPQLSDLRESGAIEQDADLVMFIYKPGYHDEGDDEGKYDKRKKAIKIEIIIAKNRNGPIDEVPLMFLEQYTKFQLAEREEEV